MTDIPDVLKEVVQLSWFTIKEGVYIYSRVQELPLKGHHLIVIEEEDEITVVTREENLPLLGEHVSNQEKWRLITIRCGNPFYCPGFIAYITQSLAAKGIDIVLTSSFRNDLVLVMEKDLEASVATLLEIGFSKR